MRIFKTSPFGYEVDLDDPKTYAYLPQTKDELWAKIFSIIGYALCYMDKFHPDHYPKEKMFFGDSPSLLGSCYEQRMRINVMIDDFCSDPKYYEYINSVEMMQEFIFLFEDETENMC